MMCVLLLCRAVQAALDATASPLLEVGINQATGVVWNITGPPDMSLMEVRVRCRFFLVFCLPCMLLLCMLACGRTGDAPN